MKRAAVGILTISIDRGYAFPLDEVIGSAVDGYHRQGKLAKQEKTKLVAEVKTFIAGRLKAVLLDRAAAAGFADVSDIVDAAMGARGGIDDLPDVWERVAALAALRAKDPAAFAAAGALFKRVGNSVKKARDEGNVVAVVVPAAEELEKEAERELAEAVVRITGGQSHEETLNEAVALTPLVERFFVDVMVMVDDARLRAARLSLLGAIEGRLIDVADFTRLQVG